MQGVNNMYQADMLNKCNWTFDYDINGNVIHAKTVTGYEEWYEYDEQGNQSHEKSSDGSERWYIYDVNGKLTNAKDSDGSEYWCDADGHKIHYKNSDGYWKTDS